MDDFAVRLRLVIKESGKQQKELASAMHLSPARFSNYVNGHSEPSLNILSTICKTLCVSADYLLGLTDTLERSKPHSLSVPQPADPFADLTPEQRTVMETTLNAFRQQNAAAREEA